MIGTEGIIVQTRISEQVYNYMRGEILSGRLAPGERVNVDELVEKLKVSRMPIKEAIERLAGEGMIRVQSRRGAFVSSLDPAELAETFEVRCALEVLAGKLAVKHITKADLETLRGLIAAMEKSTAKTDIGLHLEQNARFHELIIERSGNRKLLETYQRLRIPLQIAGIHFNTNDWIERVAREQREHRAIVRALEHHDAEAVAQAVTAHVMRAGNSLVEDVEKSAGPGGL